MVSLKVYWTSVDIAPLLCLDIWVKWPDRVTAIMAKTILIPSFLNPTLVCIFLGRLEKRSLCLRSHLDMTWDKGVRLSSNFQVGRPPSHRVWEASYLKLRMRIGKFESAVARGKNDGGQRSSSIFSRARTAYWPGEPAEIQRHCDGTFPNPVHGVPGSKGAFHYCTALAGNQYQFSPLQARLLQAAC
ncbi:hypothetical protein TNCV_3646001 [Trichonephila clavipes]|nr:hypothetical protein TNCV_3646001 [Trichonephila clavipes]